MPIILLIELHMSLAQNSKKNKKNHKFVFIYEFIIYIEFKTEILEEIFHC